MSYLSNNFRSIYFKRLINNRLFSNTSALKEKAVQDSPNKDQITQNMSSMTNIKPNYLEKWFLVWIKKYKTIEEVPPTVSQATMEYTRNKMRIRISNIMMLLTIFGCIGFIISGKNAAKRGESVQQMNLDWHKKYNEDQERLKQSKKQD